jgi:5-methylcytosine-specific restriction endonuclease McrBC GTP-binding regulatory subunit McrB
MTTKLPAKKSLVKRLINNFVKPGTKKIYLEKKEASYQITVVIDDNQHLIENLSELEEVITKDHQKVKFSYSYESSAIFGELVWEDLSN